MAPFAAVLFFAAPVQAAVWVQTTDADFNAGWLNGTEVVGTGAPAVVQLLKDAKDWTNENPASRPSAREAPALAYDSANNVVILFGGYDGTYRGDTWRYFPGNNTWWQASASGPPARELAGFTYDAANAVFVLFGGVDSGGNRADTWEYYTGNNSWWQTTPGTSPSGMGSYHLAYVASSQRSLLFGWSLTSALMETWAYNAATNAWTQRSPGTAPSVRVNYAYGYHAGLDRIVLHGGLEPLPPPGTSRGDTWEYNDAGSGTWTQTVPQGSGPSVRSQHGMAYRGTDASMYLYGGRDGGTGYSDTWQYFDDISGRVWSTVSTQRSPTAQVYFGLTNQATGGKMILFGGVTVAGTRQDQTWTYGPAFRSNGFYESVIFDSGGANVDWWNISWLPTSQAAGAVLRFQIATADVATGPWSYLGPGGNPALYYTTTPTAIWSGHDNDRFLRFRANLFTTNNVNTAVMDQVAIDYTVPPAPPFISSTTPANLAFGVSVSSTIRVQFSEAMNKTSVTWTISPPTTVTSSWSAGDSLLTLTPVPALAECKAHTVQITAGKDLDGNNLVPGPVPNPWVFTTICDPPEIVATSPVHAAVDVLLTANIIVDFSEAMIPASVNVTINPPLALTKSWSAGDSRLTLTHTSDFTECTDYTVEVTSGRDLANLSLVPGPVPNPWSFTTKCLIPRITFTNPADGQPNVGLTAPIEITFSEPMNTGTVVVTPSPFIALTYNWDPTNTILNLTHGVSFTPCTTYTITVTGQDADDGNPLGPGPVPNPFDFTTTCPNPYIVTTVPANGETGVNPVTNITIVFSEPMNTASVLFSLTPPVPLTPTWAPTNDIVTYSHSAPLFCGLNTAQVTAGQDPSGNPLVPGPVPNPWTFTVLCNEPFLTVTSPFNNESSVSLSRPIIVDFSEAMDTATVTWAINPLINLTDAWSNGDTRLTLSHVQPFLNDTQYAVAIVTGKDLDGNDLIPGPVPNPWRFTTSGLNPFITSTNPADGTIDVALTAPIVVNFSEPIDTAATVTVTIAPPLALGRTWSNGDMTLTLTHTAPFLECTPYTVEVVAAQDLDGNPLVPGPVPNPWTFTTVCVPPVITSTTPANGQTDVALNAPIVVDFSEGMDTASLGWNITPFVNLVPSWTLGNTRLTFTHMALFMDCTMYTVRVNATDVDGNPLVAGPVPNPWSFTTTCVTPPPTGLAIARVAPAIVNLTWNPVPGADLYRVYHATNRSAAWPWTVLGTTTAAGFDAVGHLNDGLDHFYIVRAERASVESTNSTMAAKIELDVTYSPTSTNVFWFSLPYRSQYATASDIANELTNSKISVVARWDASKQRSDIYHYFRGKWRGQNFAINPGDGLWIGSTSTFSWPIVGTDRLVTLSFTLNAPPKSNVNWISLPYTSTYMRASDIVVDIEGTMSSTSFIIQVGKWDAATQSVISFAWDGSAWIGTNFWVNPGDGIFLVIKQSFPWQPDLITPEVP